MQCVLNPLPADLQITAAPKAMRIDCTAVTLGNDFTALGDPGQRGGDNTEA